MSNRIVYIMRGLPGSGKSTMAKNMAGATGRVVSADDFFMVDGEYRFDVAKLGEAHGQCMRRAIEHVQRDVEAPLVVDNTNISNVEIAPYVLLAQAYGWFPQILTLHSESAYIVSVCAKRNSHGVPIERVTAMFEQLLLELPATPPWWNQQVLTPVIGS